METPTAMTSQTRGTAVSVGDWWECSVSVDAREYVEVLSLKQVSSDPSCSPNFLLFFWVPQLHLCAQLTSSAVNQGAVSVCPGAVMGKMTALTTVMRRTVRIQVGPAALLLVANISILEVQVARSLLDSLSSASTYCASQSLRSVNCLLHLQTRAGLCA